MPGFICKSCCDSGQAHFSSQTSSPFFWTLALVCHMCPCLASPFLVAWLWEGRSRFPPNRLKCRAVHAGFVRAYSAGSASCRNTGIQSIPTAPRLVYRSRRCFRRCRDKIQTPARCVKRDLAGPCLLLGWEICHCPSAEIVLLVLVLPGGWCPVLGGWPGLACGSLDGLETGRSNHSPQVRIS